MSLQEINSHEEMQAGLMEEGKAYVLLYKKGSEASDCSYVNLAEAVRAQKEIKVMVADVNRVHDIHSNYEKIGRASCRERV